MKKLTTISLFIFGVIVTAILSAGLVFYQNGKDIKTANSQVGSKISKTTNSQTSNKVSNTTKAVASSNKSLTLDMVEIAKHNKQSDCWMLINGKVYDITSFFGSHPGGNGTMISSCGRDATDAYMTKDPNATSNSGRSAHSQNAVSMLASYYLGDLNQAIGSQKVTQTNIVAPKVKTENEWGDD
jgi:cytochrome b involved in lipid metabolism